MARPLELLIEKLIVWVPLTATSVSAPVKIRDWLLVPIPLVRLYAPASVLKLIPPREKAFPRLSSVLPAVTALVNERTSPVRGTGFPPVQFMSAHSVLADPVQVSVAA